MWTLVSIEDLSLTGATQIECAELKKGQFPFLLSSPEGISIMDTARMKPAV
jgi:hypothetical protein